MGKAPKWGVNNYVKRTKKHRPGRHAKSVSKRKPKTKKYRGQGKQMKEIQVDGLKKTPKT